MLKTRYWIALTLLSVGALGGLLPETPTIPVQGATTRDWHPQSFWYYPWGRSGTQRHRYFRRKARPCWRLPTVWWCIPGSIVWAAILCWCWAASGGRIITRICKTLTRKRGTGSRRGTHWHGGYVGQRRGQTAALALRNPHAVSAAVVV